MNDLHRNEAWDKYWQIKTLKRRAIEFIRTSYFTRIFVGIVKKGQPAGALILEAGCGSGSYLRMLDKLGFKAVGLDYSMGSLEIASRNCSRLAQGDIFNLPFKSKTFDVVFNQGVMEHFNDSQFIDALRQMSRICKQIVVIVPSCYSLFRIYDPFGDDPSKRFFSSGSLQKIMSRVLANVRVRHIVRSGFLSIVGTGDSCISG